MAKVTHSEKVPQSMREMYEQIVMLTDAFSAEHLTEEYAQLIRYATAALCRKRPSPLLKGKPKTWACGITHAIGFVNFLFDRSEEPSIRASELYAAFGVSKSTGEPNQKSCVTCLTCISLIRIGVFQANLTTIQERG
ncbi:MAG: DUF6398 domain-containing protein [Candidatus Electrothrix gigas]